jgi:hypothetical protein
VVATQFTSSNGAYLFTGLAAGTYTVTVDTSSPALAGCIPTIPNAPGSNTANDSNDNPATVVLPTDSSIDLTVDFGYIPAPVGSIGDLVWKDLNGNGIQDGALVEPGIPNVTVRLYSGNTLLATQFTDLDGLYLFTGLNAGTYTVVVDSSSPALAGCLATTVNAPGSTTTNDSNPNPATVTLPLNTSSDTSIDFGYKPIPSGKIGNLVWKDLNCNGIQDTNEPGIANVPVRLETSAGVFVASMTTDCGGFYQFTGLSAGSYVVIVDNSAAALVGCVPTMANAPGSNTGNDSNANPSPVTLATNSSSDQTIDFGYKAKPPVGGFITYTMGGWGATPRGNNPGAFLAGNFATVFPSGVTLGAGKTAKFTSAKAIEVFLPSGGNPVPLSVSVVNPTSKLGVLVGQALAVKLAVSFSNAGVTRAGLANTKFVSGKFAGKTVGYVLALAEQVIGGAAPPAGISYSDLSNALTTVNENYDAGANLGNLTP